MTDTMPVLILCGGLGTRLREETEYRPKPMVEIGGRPILWHIMRIYASQGFKDFVLLTGYRGDQIKHYFLNYEALHRDFTVTLGPGGGIEYHDAEDAHDWRVTIADTGASTMTGARIKRAERYLRGDRFMLTYGDGVADIDLRGLLAAHRRANVLGTVTGVRPPSRYGELEIEGARVRQFNEKPQLHEGLINGGFFVFERGVLNYLSDDPGCVLERGPLEKLAADGQLSVYRHDGFWQSMDTYRDYQLLNQLWDGGQAPWAK
jgi:glucose-1-phosphate cytidylyltransferase